MAAGDTLHRSTASWRRPVSAFGFAGSDYDDYPTRLFDHGGGTADFNIDVSLSDWSVPIYLMSDATPGNTVRWYQNADYEMRDVAFNTFGGFPRGNTAMPWNDAWEPGANFDATLIVIDDRPGPTYGTAYEFWVVTSNSNGYAASNFAAGLSGGLLYPFFGTNFIGCPVPWTDNDPHKRVCASVSWYPNENVYDLHDTSPYLRGFRGAGTQKSVGILQADEVLRAMNGGTVGHALNMTVANPMFGPFHPSATPNTFWPGDAAHGLNTYPGNGTTYGFHEYPARRCEHPTAATAFHPTTGDWAGLTDAQQRARCVPHGMRFCLTHTDTEIETWATGKGYTGTKRSAVVAIAKTLRDEGWIITETGGYGVHIETTGIHSPTEKTRWQSTGLVVGDTFDETFLHGLVTSAAQIRVVNPPDIDGVSPLPPLSTASTFRKSTVTYTYLPATAVP